MIKNSSHFFKKADIQNHQQLALIEKLKKSLNGEVDHENNNGKSMEPELHINNNNTTPTMEIKSEANGNGMMASMDSVDSSKTMSSSGTLSLNLTVAEMRAQLKSKKRPDPKTEGLDVRKKYEIIQKM